MIPLDGVLLIVSPSQCSILSWTKSNFSLLALYKIEAVYDVDPIDFDSIYGKFNRLRLGHIRMELNLFATFFKDVSLSNSQR